MKQDTSFWMEAPDIAYHRRQFKNPYRSTVMFCDWLESLGFCSATGSSRLLDVGCGMGANAYYLSNRFAGTEVVGIDLNETLVRDGSALLEGLGPVSVRLEVRDIFSPERGLEGTYDGVISFQLLSWLPAYEEALRAMARLDPDWIAFTSLFYEGAIDTEIRCRDYTVPTGGRSYSEVFYNVYALPHVRNLLEELGYDRFVFTPFSIDMDLASPADAGFGTYTKSLADGSRLQISGPLLMPWYFVAAARSR